MPTEPSAARLLELERCMLAIRDQAGRGEGPEGLSLTYGQVERGITETLASMTAFLPVDPNRCRVCNKALVIGDPEGPYCGEHIGD